MTRTARPLRAVPLVLLLLVCSLSSTRQLQAQGRRLPADHGPAAVPHNWEPLGPRARLSYHGSYDPVRQRLMVFGGWGRAYFNDTWALSVSDEVPTWTHLTPTHPPSPRLEHITVYDPARDRLLLFGGKDQFQFFNDTWELDLGSHGEWARLEPQGTPPSPRETRGVYDPVGDRLVIFGGFGYPYHLNETWALNLSGTPTWEQLAPVGSPPAPRRGHTAIYDPAEHRVLVFGGYDDRVFYNDVWSLSLSGATAWELLTPTGTPPPARYGHAAVYDPVRQRMVVFGGYNGNFLDDAWVLDLSGAPAWAPMNDVGERPRIRDFHTIIYDPTNDRIVLYAGNDGDPLADVWELRLSGPGVPPGGGLWKALGPRARLSYHGSYDPVREDLVVFGGWGRAYFNDTWTLSVAAHTPSWTRLDPAGVPPSPRLEHTTIYDPPRDRLLLFGGKDLFQFFNDTWQLTLGPSPAWTNLSPQGTPPSPRETRAVYDPVRDRMVIVGGFGNGQHLNETWALNLSGTPTWEQLAPGGTLPAPRRGHTAVYDPVNDRILVFGGFNDITFFNDTWALALSGIPQWTKVETRGRPPSPRYGQAAAYDPVSRRMVVFGGYNGAFLDDGFALDLSATPTWSPIAGGSDQPPVRDFHTIVFDPRNDRLVLYGGNDGMPLGDVWGLSLDRGAGPPLKAANPPPAVPGEPGAGSSDPRAPTLSLDGQPRPSRGGLDVTFSLPSAGAARLEVLDVGGRVVAWREVGFLGAGQHRVDLSGGQGLPSGVFWLRLTQGNRAVSRKVVVLQ